jgi:hypothetical protein
MSLLRLAALGARQIVVFLVGAAHVLAREAPLVLLLVAEDCAAVGVANPFASFLAGPAFAPAVHVPICVPSLDTKPVACLLLVALAAGEASDQTDEETDAEEISHRCEDEA